LTITRYPELTITNFPPFLFEIKRTKGENVTSVTSDSNPEQAIPSEEWPEDWPDECEQPEQAPALVAEEPLAGPSVNWLFVDLNSYFASCEQEVRPELRGRPVGVVPMMADTTCCIAASYEAKAFGVRTGTIVADAKRMCPEMMGRERPLLAAMELGRRVKARILDQVGPMLRSSVGLATNRYLAKIASDMEKPDGLIALPIDLLPEALGQLTLRDLPGIGAKTEKRLNEKGITTMKQLLALSCEQSGELWGSVWGERLWHWLRGEDFDMAETDHLKSISHSHVLAPEMRTAEKAWAVAHKLLHKAAMRLRAGGLWASSIGLAVGFAVPRGEKAPVSRFGVPTRGWHNEIRLSECRDNPTLIAALSRLWASRPSGKEYDQPYFIGIQLNGLVPDRLHSLNLFDGSEDEQSRTRLLEVMDQLNNKYGMSTLAPATMLAAYKAAPTRIAFHSIPDLF